MDLHAWMLADVASLRGKLTSGIVAHIPTEEWPVRADGGGATLTHLLVHLTRHHDLAVNTVVRNREPRFEQHRSALGLADHPAGIGVSEAEDPAITAAPPDAVLDYLTDVFDRTSSWLDQLGSMALDTCPDVSRRLRDLAGLDEQEFDWLHRQWSSQPVWWFIQWPVIGHGYAHVGEALGLRHRFGRSPF